MSIKTSLLIIAIIFLCLGAILVVLNLQTSKQNPLINPQVVSSKVNQVTPTPVVYNFDSSTNLKNELESINPKVLESDFEEINIVISDL